MPKGTKFSYVIFTEQRNFTMAERRNGKERMAAELWKPGISLSLAVLMFTVVTGFAASFSAEYKLLETESTSCCGYVDRAVI